MCVPLRAACVWLLLGVTHGAAAASPVAVWVEVDDPARLPADALPTEERRIVDGRTQWRVWVDDPALLAPWPTRPAPAPPAPAGWPDPDDVALRLAAAAARSDRAGVAVLGRSRLGRDVVGGWIGALPVEGAPVVRVLGGHHGDELPSWTLALEVYEALVERDASVPEVASWLDDTTVWVVPCVNPDGVVSGTRWNDARVDLNRNYEAWWAPSAWAGARPFSEPETRAIRAFGDVVRPVLSVSVHAGADNLGWPWNHTVTDPPDAATFERLADDYLAGNGSPGFWVSQGAEWYPSTGDTNDWAYARWGVLDLTLEVSVNKAPPPSGMTAIRDEHLEPLLAWLATPPSWTGRVVSSDGAPLEARLHVPGTTDTWTDPSTGRFARLLERDAATATVWAPGFSPRTVPIEGPQPVVLAPSSTIGRPASPWVVRGRAPVSFGGPAVLTRAGAPDLAVPSPAGRAILDAADLAPGPWTIVAADGSVTPRGVVIEDAASVVVQGRTAVDGGVHLWGAGFGAGARAFAVRGPARTLVEVPARVQDDGGSLFVEGAPPLLVYTAGAVLAVAPEDLADPPPKETGERLLVTGTCASTPERGNFGLGVGSMLLAGARRRRRTCGGGWWRGASRWVPGSRAWRRERRRATSSPSSSWRGARGS